MGGGRRSAASSSSPAAMVAAAGCPHAEGLDPFQRQGRRGEWSGKRSAPPGGGQFGLGRADGEATAGGSAGGRRVHVAPGQVARGT